MKAVNATQIMKAMWMSPPPKKNKTKATAPKKSKTKTLCGKVKKKMTKEQKNNKWKSSATFFVPLKKVDSINFHPKIEMIEEMTPYETYLLMQYLITF